MSKQLADLLIVVMYINMIFIPIIERYLSFRKDFKDIVEEVAEFANKQVALRCKAIDDVNSTINKITKNQYGDIVYIGDIPKSERIRLRSMCITRNEKYKSTNKVAEDKQVIKS